jgi:hypothetical protein
MDLRNAAENERHRVRVLLHWDGLLARIHVPIQKILKSPPDTHLALQRVLHGVPEK